MEEHPLEILKQQKQRVMGKSSDHARVKDKGNKAILEDSRPQGVYSQRTNKNNEGGMSKKVKDKKKMGQLHVHGTMGHLVVLITPQ